MSPRLRPCFLLLISFACAACPARAAAPTATILFQDDYSAMKPGMISGGVVGAHTEYHYLPEAAPHGNWAVSNFRSSPGSQRAWHVIAQDDGSHLLYQNYSCTEGERTHLHPQVVAGDDLWQDYEVETRFAPAVDDGGQSGVLFRTRHDLAYYFVGVIGQKAVLKLVHNGSGYRTLNEKVLLEKPFAWKPGEFIPVHISVRGDALRATLGSAVLEIRDGTFPRGKIAFTSDVPARFGPVTVTCTPAAKQQFERERSAREAEEQKLQAENPRPVVWKKISLGNFGVGRNLRFGDLDGDGATDILVVQVTHHGPGDGYSEVACMTALNLDGRVLWRNGTPDSFKTHLTNDVAVQIHDLDGDGKNEVIYCRDFEIVVADGSSGETKYKAPTPAAVPNPPQRLRFPRILGDSMLFADLRGTGHPRDIILKDRYRNVWAFTDKLEPLWHVPRNTGHYPFPVDVDGDGKQEVMVGYSLLSPEGKILWSNEHAIKDHADGVAILRFKDGGDLRLVCNASDEGIFFADMTGKILKHHHIGHTQNVSVADYRPDLPGLEIAAIDFWATQGVINLLDADGNVYRDFEPVQHGSMLLPVNWTGKPQEYWLLSANSLEGGLYDGWGRRVVRFPADAHPQQCTDVLDLTGDARDEIVVWDPYELWIYTQSDNPKPGRLYQPKRNPRHNSSNYQTTVSLPGWSE